MKFKGTKGKWGVNKNQIQVDIDNPLNTSSICTLFGYGEEKEANGKLISYAPEMLDMLKEVLAAEVLKGTITESKIKKLIRSATEV